MPYITFVQGPQKVMNQNIGICHIRLSLILFMEHSLSLAPKSRGLDAPEILISDEMRYTCVERW